MGRRLRETSRALVGVLAVAGLCGCPSQKTSAAAEEPKAKPSPSGNEPGIDPTVEAKVGAIASAMNHYGVAIHTCWAMAAADDLRVEGRVELLLVLGAEGVVDKVIVEKDEPGDKILTECLTALWGRAKWPAVFEAGESIRLPPLSFVAPASQHVIASAHAVSYPLGKSGASHATILVDYKNSGNSGAAMTALTLEPGFDVPLHKHNATEILYILKGKGVLGAGGRGKGKSVSSGSALYIPTGAPHSFTATSNEPSVILQIYAPGGPEQRFKGIDIGGTTALTKAPKGAPKAVVRTHSDVPALAIAGGKVSLLFGAESAPDNRASVAGMTLDADAAVVKHHHESSTELLFVLEGGGTLTVAGLEREVARFDAIQIPPGVSHSFRNGGETTKVIQSYSPSGPEQRFKGR